MPVQFEGILAEHRAVRERAGLFDISHMGQIWVMGAGARATLQKLVTNDVGSLAPGRGMYALLCREDGGVVDDLYVYALEPDRFLVIANASRAAVDFEWIKARRGPGTDLVEQPQAAAVALQGPLAETIMSVISGEAVSLSKNGVGEFQVMDMECVIARTGYTGEDGFEIFAPAGHLMGIHDALLKKGAPMGLALCGLGARDTLRLEMGYRLYGQDLDEGHSPLDAGLEWAVKWDKGDFIGRGALRRQKEEGLRRRLIALRLADRGVPRHGSEMIAGGKTVGVLSSGTYSPSLSIGIGLGYADYELFPKSLETAPMAVRVHGRDIPAQMVPLPFYRKRK